MSEEEMENRARVLRVLKKKPTKRSGRKLLLNKVLEYLKSDSFMYGPLVSDLPSPNSFPFSSKVVEVKKPIKEKQRLREQVGDYLKSDVYLYNSLLDLPHSPLQEPLKDCGTKRMDVSTRLTMKVSQRTNHLGNANQRSESHLPQTGLSDQHTLGNSEAAKHTVYQICRSTSASRNVTLNSHLRAKT